ncbi:Proteobacterial dedicated sortase system histidine kinase [Alteromonas sp. 38]|uniref:proteobacterial dedicated sortase system histidine kinase n=1 Tax=Alteromonas TaxID=226 RepID=UPI0012F05559|nr:MULTISPECIES: proteobacterial dedicated sortase system histidine kinase [Alteromonas]CAD5249759.1 Proteobacterial dedicated sortase system histidine kinase [Alteromonas sp. 154]VXC43682.1 Proteobacterial dedicated sortase system histidine kinase [Alteromonas sp. 38]
MRLRFSIRLQLLVLSLFFFAIPYLGYNYVWELEQYLRTGQEQTMIGTARAVATALHERPALFDSESAYLKDVRPGTDLYAPPIPYPIQLDGELNDWQQVDDLLTHYGASEIVERFTNLHTNDENKGAASENRGTASVDKAISLSFEHMVGRYDQFLYAMFNVTDDALLWRQANSLSVERGDHLLIGMQTPAGNLARYVVAPYESGWVNAFKLAESGSAYRAVENALSIQGRWQETATGYNIELRFPLSMTSGALAFAIVDVDDPVTRQKRYAIGTANTNNIDELGTVVTPSPEIERILAGLKYADSRVWVIDNHKRVLARAGDIQTASGLNTAKREASENPVWQWVETHWLLPLYYHILTKPPADFVDELEDAYALAGRDIGLALNGQPDSLWRLTPDNKAVVVSAAYPIFIEGAVMGAVVVEQTTNGIRTLRNRALEQLFHVILAVMLLGTLGLLLFASRISNRIRRLRDNTEAIIDANGKIVGKLPVAKEGDEIGDLSRAFSDVLTRLQQYNSYLENMASRLSHELRTPIAVVKSSLDALSQVSAQDSTQAKTQQPNTSQEDQANAVVQSSTQQDVFVQRAQSGISRLSSILNAMSEATRLEQAIAQEDVTTFNLIDVIKGCVGGYQHAYTDRQFALSCASDAAVLEGAPDLIAQMFDKIISNAVDFSQPDDIIDVAVYTKDKRIILTVNNPGPLLPEGMKKQLVQSMVSVRPDSEAAQSAGSPHLGLGLYIADIIVAFHQGTLALANRDDKRGVIVSVNFPKI